MHEDTQTYELRLVGPEQPITARVVVHVRDWTADAQRNRICTIALTSTERSVEASSGSVYHAFQDLRLKLESEGLTPDCFGACPNVQTSGMLCDMGDGTYAYRMRTAGDRAPEQVNIFEWKPGLKLGTVAQQKAFFDSCIP